MQSLLDSFDDDPEFTSSPQPNADEQFQNASFGTKQNSVGAMLSPAQQNQSVPPVEGEPNSGTTRNVSDPLVAPWLEPTRSNLWSSSTSTSSIGNTPEKAQSGPNWVCYPACVFASPA